MGARRGVHLDLDIGGRDRDRAEQRSPSLEPIDQLFGTSLGHALDLDLHPDAVEQPVLRVRLVVGIDLGVDTNVYVAEWNAVVAREHLEELHGAARNAAKEQLAGHQCLAGKAVPRRPIHRHMMVPGVQLHPSEDVGRTRFGGILPDVRHA